MKAQENPIIPTKEICYDKVTGGNQIVSSQINKLKIKKHMKYTFSQ